MSKIDNLISQLCPNGAKFSELSEVCKSISAGGDLPKNLAKGQVKPSEEFPFPVYSNGSNDKALYGFTDGYKVGEEAVTISARGTIGFHAIRKKHFTPIVRLITLIPNVEVVTTKFLNYALDITDIGHSGGSVPQLTVPNVKKIKIPVPPIKIQREIVNILDKFTQLEAELEARKKQYEYYRNQLLTFDDAGGVRWTTLELAMHKITDGSHVSPKSAQQGYYMPSVKDMRSDGFDFSDCKIISENDYKSLARNGCKPYENDVLVAKDGSMLKYAFVVEEERDIVVLSSIAIFRPKTNLVSPRYLAHYFRQNNFKEVVIRDYSSKGGVPRIILKNFKKVKIPLPSITEQNRIVSTLDKFDKLVNDISEGLPAELNARRQQYEYYRNKLLTFKELPA